MTPPPLTLSGALAQLIREKLKTEGWSQRELARRLGISQGEVSFLLKEQRRAKSLAFYQRLAGVFEMPLSRLILALEQRVYEHASRRGPQPPTPDSSPRKVR